MSMLELKFSEAKKHSHLNVGDHITHRQTDNLRGSLMSEELTKVVLHHFLTL